MLPEFSRLVEAPTRSDLGRNAPGVKEHAVRASTRAAAPATPNTDDDEDDPPPPPEGIDPNAVAA